MCIPVWERDFQSWEVFWKNIASAWNKPMLSIEETILKWNG